jgi:hypothetical protein
MLERINPAELLSPGDWFLRTRNLSKANPATLSVFAIIRSGLRAVTMGEPVWLMLSVRAQSNRLRAGQPNDGIFAYYSLLSAEAFELRSADQGWESLEAAILSKKN